MTDLEMTKRCAEAMGIAIREATWCQRSYWVAVSRGNPAYNPLHDDAQAMALLKRLRLTVETVEVGAWLVHSAEAYAQHGEHTEATGPDLNRAIVECVAKMQEARP